METPALPDGCLVPSQRRPEMGSEVLKSTGKSWEGMEGGKRKPRYLKNLKLGAGRGGERMEEGENKVQKKKK